MCQSAGIVLVASVTGRRSARTRRAKSANSPWRMSTAIAWRRPTGVATCSSGGARWWRTGPPTSPEGRRRNRDAAVPARSVPSSTKYPRHIRFQVTLLAVRHAHALLAGDLRQHACPLARLWDTSHHNPGRYQDDGTDNGGGAMHQKRTAQRSLFDPEPVRLPPRRSTSRCPGPVPWRYPDQVAQSQHLRSSRGRCPGDKLSTKAEKLPG